MLIRIAGHDWLIAPANKEMLGQGLMGVTKHVEREIRFSTIPLLEDQRETIVH